jgi:HEXXH motif-containing protein
MITSHRLRQPDFDALARGLGDPAAVRALRTGQLSKHLLQLRALLDAARPAGLRPVLEPGFQLLAATQQQAPEAVTALLLHPPVGGWLAHCLRLLRGGDSRSPSTAADLGHVGAIAAAAAHRAGVSFEIIVPARDRSVMLPMLGTAVLPGLRPGTPVTISGQAGQPVTIRAAAGDSVMLPGDPSAPAPGWLPLRRLTADGDPQLEIYLDDLDPFRDCHGAGTAGRLDDHSARRWRELIQTAWTLLTGRHPGYARAIAAGLATIVPLRTSPGGRGATATSPDSFGACLMSEPVDALALAVGLVHEFQHAKLGALMDMLPLHTADRTARYYAPWRDDPRPLDGLLHGTYAFAAVTEFWRVQRTVAPSTQATFAHFEFARWRTQTLLAARTLRASGRLTEWGAAVVTAVQERMLGWAADEVPAAAASAARAAVADHEVSWRLRHLRPDPGQVQRMASAWLAGQPCPRADLLPPEVRPGGLALTDNGRRDLLLLRLRDPRRFTRISTRPGELAALVPDASDVDVAYLQGDLDRASAGYQRMLRARPDRLTAWAGLALISCRRAAGRPEPLADTPELIMAIYQRLADLGTEPPGPGELADWVGRAPVRAGAARYRTAAGSGSLPGPLRGHR